MTDEALAALSGHFDTLYAAGGRPSIAPEKLMRALLLQALYSVRSERQLMEQLDYNLLFRWFVGLNMDDAIWDVTVFTKNRERLLRGEVAERLLLAVVEQAHAKRLLSEEHFTVDGTLIQAWANRRSFKEKPEPPDRGTGARGKKLLRDTHESTTDADARLYRKSSSGASVPSYLGHVITENRNGLVVQAMATQSSTRAEREAALAMLDKMRRRDGPITVEQLRARGVVPHVAEYAPNPKWPSFLTDEERSGKASRSASANASWWRRSSVGLSPNGRCGRPSSVVCRESDGWSSYWPPHTTCDGCKRCFKPCKTPADVSPQGSKEHLRDRKQDQQNNSKTRETTPGRRTKQKPQRFSAACSAVPLRRAKPI
jgi:transposase